MQRELAPERRVRRPPGDSTPSRTPQRWPRRGSAGEINAEGAAGLLPAPVKLSSRRLRRRLPERSAAPEPRPGRAPARRSPVTPGRLPGSSRAAERRPPRLSVKQGGLSPPEPSSVRPSQGARRREASGRLGAAGGGSDGGGGGGGGGDPEVRKRGTGGRRAGRRKGSGARRPGGIEDGRTGEDHGRAAGVLRGHGGGRRETAERGDVGRGGAASETPLAACQCQGEGAGCERAWGPVLEAAGRCAPCRGRGRGRQTLRSLEPPLQVGRERAREGRWGRGEGAQTPSSGPGREGAAPRVSAAWIPAGWGRRAEGREGAGSEGVGHPQDPGGRGAGEWRPPVSGGLLCLDEESQTPHKFLNALTGTQSLKVFF